MDQRRTEHTAGIAGRLDAIADPGAQRAGRDGNTQGDPHNVSVQAAPVIYPSADSGKSK